MRYDIVHGTNSGRAKVISPVDLMNIYPEIEEAEESKFTKALIGCPGYTLAVTALTTGFSRALYTTSTERLFTIISNKLIEISTSETATVRGTLNTSSSICVMCDNGTQMLIVDGTDGYIFTLATNVLAVISGTFLPSSPTHCIFTDGYFLVNSAGTGKFHFSASYDGETWAAADFATAEYSADTLQGISKTSNGTTWMIGKRSVELWNNVGTADLPWRRISGSVKEKGCIAPYTINSNGDSVFWLGNGSNGYGVVYMGVGYDIIKISTSAIEYQIKQFTNIDQAIGYSYSDEGHQFYVLCFLSEASLVYDITTGEWHKRGTYNSATGKNIRNFAQWCAFFNNKNYVGSHVDGGIYSMSLDVYDEAGSTILREIITPTISNENKLLRHNKLVIDIETGVGLVNDSAPVIMVQYTHDGGHTWSNINANMSPGEIGNYTKRAIIRRLGRSRNRSYKIAISDPVKFVVTSAFIEVE